MPTLSLKDALDDEALVRSCRRPPRILVWKPVVYFAILVAFTVAGGRLQAPWSLLAQFIGAISVVLLFTILHAASHYHLSAKGRVNDFVGSCAALVLGTSLSAYRVAHLRHHSRLRTPDDPQEAVFTKPD